MYVIINFYTLSYSVVVTRVATYKQLDSDLHKHAGLFMLVSEPIPPPPPPTPIL